jgi:hypothetical protein
MIAYKFRVSFEENDEVERVIEILSNQTLLDLHKAILAAIGFKPDTPASFYVTGDHWRKGKRYVHEIQSGEETPMSSAKLNNVVNDPHQRFLYITDDEMGWELRVILRGLFSSDATKTYPSLIRAVGPNPKQNNIHVIGAPTNEFERMVDELVKQEEAHELSDDFHELDESDDNETDNDSESGEEDEL